MGAAKKFPGLFCGLMGIIATWGMLAGGADGADAWRSRVSAKLLSVYDNPASAAATAGGAHVNAQGLVQVDVHYDCSLAPPTDELVAAGLSPGTSAKLGPLCVVEGWAAPASLARIAQASGVTRLEVPSYVIHKTPRSLATQQEAKLSPRAHAAAAARPAAGAGSASIDNYGVLITQAGLFVSQTGVTGGGVTVGVQSTGVASIQTIQERNELPVVKQVAPAGGAHNSAADEGTVLLEEVHAVAPGANLAFCEPETFVEYTSCLGQLVAAGATILADDVVFTQGDLLTSDNSDVQALQQFLAQNPNVTVFTAVGNYNGSYWEGQYTPVSLASLGMSATMPCTSNGTTVQTDQYITEFNGSPSQTLTVTGSASVPVAFAWSDPPGHNASKFDIHWVGSSGGTLTTDGCLSTASATDHQVAQNISLAAGTYKVFIATPDPTPAGKFLKLWIGGDGLTSISDSTSGSVITPQAFTPGVVSVGAVNGSDGVGSNIESFSSLGPISVSFPTTAKLQAPVLVAPDGIYVDAAGTDFAGDLFPDGNFYGTSASTPNAAAVATLILSAFPNLTVPQLIAALQKGATVLGASAPDDTFGYGRVNALNTLATFPLPTITSLPDSSLNAGSSSQAFPFTVSGFGNLHFQITSSNTALIPASVVAAGAPGVTISPSDCGVTTLNCTATITVANGVSDTVSLTIAALDGANRPAPASLKVTVAGSAAPPTTATPTPTPSGGGGGSLSNWELAALFLILLLRRRVPR